MEEQLPNVTGIQQLEHGYGCIVRGRFESVFTEESDGQAGRTYQAIMNTITAAGGLAKAIEDGLVTPLPTPTLDEVKAAAIADIDRQTFLLITSGFTFDGKQFSMSEAAQRNWTQLAVAHALGILPFPAKVSTQDPAEYLIEDEATLLAFLGTMMQYQTNPSMPLQSGRELKELVNDCETIEAVAAIVDDRTE